MEHTKGKIKMSKLGDEFHYKIKSKTNNEMVFVPLDNEAEANAKRLVKCWNNFDSILQALKDIVECSPCQNGCAKDDMTCATRKAEQAISEAE